MDLTIYLGAAAWSSLHRWSTPLSTVLNEDSKQETRSKTFCSLCDHGLPSEICDDPTGAGEVLKSKAGRAGAVLRRRNVDHIDCAGHDDIHLACWPRKQSTVAVEDHGTAYVAADTRIACNCHLNLEKRHLR